MGTILLSLRFVRLHHTHRIVIMDFLHGARAIDSGAEVHGPASVCVGFSDTTPPSDCLFLFLWYFFFSGTLIFIGIFELNKVCVMKPTRI